MNPIYLRARHPIGDNRLRSLPEEMSLSANPVEISVVIPVHDEEGNLRELHRRLDGTLRALGRPYEVIYVDDGSDDRSLEVLTDLRRGDPRTIRIVELYRNYGQFSAIMAGLERVRGEIVVTLDADLQNPPEEIPKLVAKIDEGYDVVNGWRRHRHDSAFRRLASRLANRLAVLMTGVDVHDHGCMLRAYHREIVRQVVSCVEHSPYVPTLANGLARRAIEVEVGHARRTSGRSNYTFRGLVHLLYDMLTSFSFLPLRSLSALGLLISIGAALAAAAMVLRGLLGGFASGVSGLLTAFLFLLIGVLFSALGLVGEYVGRIHSEVRKRPRFVVRRHHDVPVEFTPPAVEYAATEVKVPLVTARDDDGLQT